MADRLIDFGLVKIKLSQKIVRQGKFRIEGESLERIFFGDRSEIVTQKHAGAKKISCRRIRGHTKHFRERFTSSRVLLGLETGNAKDVSSIDVGTGISGLYFLQIRESHRQDFRRGIRRSPSIE